MAALDVLLDVVAFRVGVSNEGSARPSEVVAALFGPEVAADAELARLALHAEGGVDPLQTLELRREAPVEAATLPAAL